MPEVWSDVKGYEGYYQVSSYGKVRSLDRTDSIGRMIRGKVRKPRPDSYGYLQVGLYKGGDEIKWLVHRLVAEAFVINSDNKIEINHLDGNKLNNKANNLRWCTRSENIKHSYSAGLRKTKRMHPRHKVKQVTQQGEALYIFNSITDAAKSLGNRVSCSPISACCRGKKKTAYGYGWEYVG